MKHLESGRHIPPPEYESPSPQRVVDFIAPQRSAAQITNISGTLEEGLDPDKRYATIRRIGIKFPGFRNTDMDETLRISLADMKRASEWTLEKFNQSQQCVIDPLKLESPKPDLDEIVRFIGAGIFLNELIIYKQVNRDYK